MSTFEFLTQVQDVLDAQKTRAITKRVLDRIEHFESEIELTVVDRNGKPTEEDKRHISGSPISFFFPNEPIILVNWLHDGAKKPGVKEIKTPVKFEGIEYNAALGWGSSVKRGYTYGMSRDISQDANLAKFAEDGQRFGRAFMADGMYGSATGEFRVKFVKPGTVIPGVGPVEDGFGYIASDVADVVYNDRPKITLGQANDSYHFWQRVPWTPEVEAESVPVINETLTELSESILHYLDRGGSAFEERKRFVDAEPRMALHPWVANALARSSGEAVTRAAMTVKTNSVTRVAVPALVDTITEPGKKIITRYPLDSWGGSRATNEDADKVAAEKARVDAMEVVQYTFLAVDGESRCFIKGNVGIVDADKLDGYDMIVCTEDRKMSVSKHSIINVRGIFTALQWWGAGSAIGINAKFFKGMGGDFDGDSPTITDCSDRPALWNAVSKYPDQDTPKLQKTHTALSKGDERAGLVVKSMQNIVGMATNLMAATFSFEDRGWLCKKLGFKSLESLDNRLNFWVKVGTDLYKTNLDAAEIEKQMAQFQAGLTKLIGRLPAWCGWPNEWAFRHGVPEFFSENEMGHFDRNDPVHRNSVNSSFDGTIARILRHTLPAVKDIVEAPIESAPLMEFLNWAPRVGDELVRKASELQTRFSARTQSVNWEWDKAVDSFKAWWRAEVSQFEMENGLSKWDACSAIWRAAHSVRSTYSGAASVFMAYPDECLRFVIEKPGLNGAPIIGVILGFPQDIEMAERRARVVEFTEASKDGKKRWVRKALQMAEKQYNFAPDQPVPPVGNYLVTLSHRSAKSHFALCEAI